MQALADGNFEAEALDGVPEPDGERDIRLGAVKAAKRRREDFPDKVTAAEEANRKGKEEIKEAVSGEAMIARPSSRRSSARAWATLSRSKAQMAEQEMYRGVD